MPPLALSVLLETSRPKGFRGGTHRSVAPAETLARVQPHAAEMGITRLGNITGLDRIGIPVAIAVRPNSRSISVSQGKGLELAQAMASALMEACELYHAEAVTPCRRATYRALAAQESVVDPAVLGGGVRAFDPDDSIGWMQGYDLLRCQACWVPAEVVHTDYSLLHPDGYFLAGTNGLASGNDLVEAINAALYELIERDAVALWAARPVHGRAAGALDLASVDDPACRLLLDAYSAAAVAVRAWNLTTDIGLAAFLCEIHDLVAGEPGRLRRFHGSGCHADRGVALIRALTEAAQTRLTYIAGSRDDLVAAEYAEVPGAEIGDALLDALAREAGHIAFGEVPNFSDDDLCGDLRWILGRLAATGLTQAIAVDLTRPEFAVPVVRLIVPGLEWDRHHPNYRPGIRARAQVRQAG